MSTKSIKLESTAQRILLIGIGLLCLVFLVFVTKWFFGNSISRRVFQQDVAQFAVSLAPSDPQTHYTSGVLYEQSFQSEDLPKALAEYEKAVALSPNNYLLWVAYGKAKERNGDSSGAEKALLKALDLAPNYSEVHWIYGNILLRQGKTSDAFSAIRKAVEGDSKYANPAASIAWDIYEGDIDEVKNAIGDSVSVKSSLAILLSGQGSHEKAFEIWQTISEEDRKTTFRSDSEKLLNQLIGKKKYRSAVKVKSDLNGDNSKKISIGRVTNGGFEEAISAEKASIFEWRIAKGRHPKIGVSIEQKRQGEKSLALIFNSASGNGFRSITQSIAVEGDAAYEFEVFYKSSLEASASVKWEVLDVESGKVLASTSSVKKTSDWKTLNANFRTPVDANGIKVRLVQEKCASTDCSVKGTVWFDDVSLK